MHICIVHQYFLGKNDAGGSRWNQFAKYWAQAGHKITILAGTVHYATGKKRPEYKGKFFFQESEGQNITVIRCYVSRSYNKNFIGRFWGYISFTFSSVLTGLLKVKRPDVIVCTSPPLTVGLMGLLLAKFKKVPMIFEVRDLWPESAIDTGVLQNKWLIKLSYWLEQISYKSSVWINVLTPAFKEILIKDKGIHPDRISMIPNGADLDIFKPGQLNNWVREKHNLEDKFVVTYVGAHGRANALTQLVDVAEKLKDRNDIMIMLVGDGMEKPMLKKDAQNRGLNNIIFVDAVPKEQIVDYITASNVCTAVLKKLDVFKTVYPNKVFDYMSCAKPVIIGIDGVARRLIEKSNAGFYIEPENCGDFVEKVIYLKNHPRKARELGANGLEFVRRNFSRLKLAQDYLFVVEKVCSEFGKHRASR